MKQNMWLRNTTDRIDSMVVRPGELFIKQPLKAQGILLSQMLLAYGEPTCSLEELPTEFPYEMSLRDMYGTYHQEQVWPSDSLRDKVVELYEEMALVDTSYNVFNTNFPMSRGGMYKLYVNNPTFGIKVDTALVFHAEPSFRASGVQMCCVGHDEMLYMKYVFSTGYPYDQDTLRAEELMQLKMYRNIKEGKQLMGERTDTFTLLDRERPLLAGEYSSVIHPQLTECGSYDLEMHTTWNDIVDVKHFEVYDTLRADVALDKEAYQLRVDKKAILNVKMDYGYPYVQKEERDDKPTISVWYDLSGVKDDKTVSYLKDTLLIADDTLAINHVNLERNIEIPLGEAFADYTAKAEKDTLCLDVCIFFNGSTQYSKTLPMVIQNTPTGLKLVPAGATDDGKAEYFNIQGQPLTSPDAEPRLGHQASWRQGCKGV